MDIAIPIIPRYVDHEYLPHFALCMNITDNTKVKGMYRERTAVGIPAPPVDPAASIDLKNEMIDTADNTDKRITHPVVFGDSSVLMAVFLYPPLFINMYIRNNVMKNTLPRRYNHTRISVFMCGYFVVTNS